MKRFLINLLRKFKSVIFANNSDWVPIGERFPNESEYLKDNGWFMVTRQWENRVFVSDAHLSTWDDEWETDYYGGTLDDVIAWQPLPEPYRPKEGK